MNHMTLEKQQESAAIRDVILSTPLAPVSSLPDIWQQIDAGQAHTLLSGTARQLYVESAAQFRYNDTAMGLDALQAVGNDFDRDAYPDLNRYHGDIDLRGRVYAALRELHDVFGYDIPAAFYNTLIGTLEEDDAILGKQLFTDPENLTRDRLWDAVLHAVLLVTPIAMKVQSVLSYHGVMIIHLMKCRCKIKEWPHKPLDVTLDDTLKTFYLQNVVAAAMEQYGVNAHSSGKARSY